MYTTCRYYRLNVYIYIYIHGMIMDHFFLVAIFFNDPYNLTGGVNIEPCSFYTRIS